MVDAILALQTAGVTVSPVSMALACPNVTLPIKITDTCIPPSYSFRLTLREVRASSPISQH